MEQQTNPQGEVSQGMSDVDRVSRFLSQPPSQGPDEDREQPTSPEPTEATQPSEESQSQAPEPTVEDLDAGEVQGQPAVDAFEIVHNGQAKKLTREEAIKYAMQGFDYTQKTQAVAAKDRAIEQQLRVLSEVQQAQPYLMQERAQVAAIQQQLGAYQNFNWVELATNDPMGYPAVRAKYDVLQQAYQQAVGQYQAKENAVNQHLGQVKQARLAQEYSRVADLIPEWKDPQKRQSGEQALAKHYEQTYGASLEDLNGRLTDAFSMAVAYKAMKYDQLVRAKGDKVKQLRTAPPVTVPGAKTGNAKADKGRELEAKLRKSGSLEDAAALLLNRMSK